MDTKVDTELKTQRCTYCHKTKPVTEFKIKKDKQLTKLCISCLNRRNEYMAKHKCPHGKRPARCRQCHGSEICEHNKYITHCKFCRSTLHLANLVCCRFNREVGGGTKSEVQKHLGCTFEEFKEYINKQLVNHPDWTWQNFGKLWNLDHDTPINYNNPTIEEVFQRFHYTNVQVLSVHDNSSKGNRYIGKPEAKNDE